MARPVAAGGRYTWVAIAFHWTIAALVLANLVIGIGHESVPALRAAMGAHKAIGLTVLALTVGRVAWRMAHRAPPLPAGTPAWQKAAAHGVHWLLYTLLVAMPVTGWMMVSAGGKPRPLTWFGVFDVPKLPIGAAAADAGHEMHELLGWLMLALVTVHVGAALWHASRRDGVLSRMLPATS